MWLRDSTNQVNPYLPFAQFDSELSDLITGLIKRQTKQILLDPYANAFKHEKFGGTNEWAKTDKTYKRGYLNTRIDAMGPLIFERKFELDSLCAFLKLASQYFEHNPKDIRAYDEQFIKAIHLVIETIKVQQKGTDEEFGSEAYTFQRTTTQPTETLYHGKFCSPAKRCGLSKSPFRPSDDACHFPFPVRYFLIS